MFEWLYRWLDDWASGGDDPSGPWPVRDEYRDLNLWP